MKSLLVITTLAVLALGAAWAAQPARPAPAAPDRLARGEHLVRHVALCADCHAPRLPSGEFDPARWLGGAPIPFAPTVPMPWAPVAPPLAGLHGFSDAHIVTLLTTGARPDGTAPRPPMPAFKLTDDEARAVVAYLRHLAPRH